LHCHHDTYLQINCLLLIITIIIHYNGRKGRMVYTVVPISEDVAMLQKTSVCVCACVRACVRACVCVCVCTIS
jgi:hypothetical protein